MLGIPRRSAEVEWLGDGFLLTVNIRIYEDMQKWMYIDVNIWMYHNLSMYEHTNVRIWECILDIYIYIYMYVYMHIMIYVQTSPVKNKNMIVMTNGAVTAGSPWNLGRHVRESRGHSATSQQIPSPSESHEKRLALERSSHQQLPSCPKNWLSICPFVQLSR